MGELEPCPFCGSTMQVAMRNAMICLECYASGPQGEDRKALWNRRAIPAADARADALKEAASHVFVLLHNTPAYVDARTLRDLVPESILALIPEAKP